MPAMRRQTRLIEPFLRPLALGLFGFYLLWNGAWLTSGSIPASILTAFTGLPCPTTGGTRSLVAAFGGNWAESVLWNPLTFVYLALAAWSAAALGAQLVRRRRLVLQPALVRLWGVALGLGWAAKLALGPRFW